MWINEYESLKAIVVYGFDVRKLKDWEKECGDGKGGKIKLIKGSEDDPCTARLMVEGREDSKAPKDGIMVFTWPEFLKYGEKKLVTREHLKGRLSEIQPEN